MGPMKVTQLCGENVLLNGHKLYASARLAVVASALAVMTLAAGCQQARNDPSATGALDTGAYPNLNIKPGVAYQQLTAEELAIEKAKLSGAAAGNAGRNAAVPNDEARLRRLAAQHEREALARIEAAQ